jgi:hypothetical protein
MSHSPFAYASPVTVVHGNQSLLPSDSWPYMATAYPAVVDVSAAARMAPMEGRNYPSQIPTLHPQAPNTPFMHQAQSIAAPLQAAGIPPACSASSGFKYAGASATAADETKQLLLFAGLAGASILALDLSLKYLLKIKGK